MNTNNKIRIKYEQKWYTFYKVYIRPGYADVWTINNHIGTVALEMGKPESKANAKLKLMELLK